MLRNVALRLRQAPAKSLLEAVPEELLRELEGRPAYWITWTVSIPDSSSKNQPQLVYMSMACRCSSSSFKALRSALARLSGRRACRPKKRVHGCPASGRG